MKRAVSVNEMLARKFNTIDFDGRWKASLGTPELSGAWLIWGNSGNGKTRFSLALAKYLCRFETVLYNSLEEGVALSFQKAIKETNMLEVSRRFKIVSEDIDQLSKRLASRKSPNIIVCDSLQYLGLTYEDYKQVKKRFPKKLFIYISHARGRNPKGAAAEAIRFDADIKIHVEGYVANPTSRFGGGEPYVIWEQGAIESGHLIEDHR